MQADGGGKMSLPYFPLFVTDFEADTSHLTMTEDGAYNRLLRLCWMTPGCSLPDDDAWILRRMRAVSDDERAAVLSVISEFFTRRNGRVFSPRLVREWKKVNETSRKRSEAGKRGGRPKAVENKQEDEKPGFDFDKAQKSYPEPEPDIYSVTNVTGAGAPQPVDFTKEVFDRGVAFLSKYGTAEKQARGLIGKWRKQAGDTETFNALRDANREGVTEPVAWITARLNGKSSQPSMAEIFAELDRQKGGH